MEWNLAISSPCLLRRSDAFPATKAGLNQL